MSKTNVIYAILIMLDSLAQTCELCSYPKSGCILSIDTHRSVMLLEILKRSGKKEDISLEIRGYRIIGRCSPQVT